MMNYAQLKPGPGFELDRALGYYAQRLVTLPKARKVVSSVIASRLSHLRDPSIADSMSPETAAILAELKSDGFAMMKPIVSDQVIGRMIDYFNASQVLGPDGKSYYLKDLPAGTSTANYALKTILDCPDMQSVLAQPQILQIADGYLECKPTLSSLGVRWSFPRGKKVEDTQMFHRDLDDWRMFKVFIYLTDVDEQSGPHIYIRKTHKLPWGLRASVHDMESMAARHGRENFETVLGPAGTTFAADTLGVHCGIPPVERPRLLFTAQYSLLPVFAFKYEPVDLKEPWGDAYVNRLLMKRSGPV